MKGSALIIDKGSGDVHRDGLAVDDGDGAEAACNAGAMEVMVILEAAIKRRAHSAPSTLPIHGLPKEFLDYIDTSIFREFEQPYFLTHF